MHPARASVFSKETSCPPKPCKLETEGWTYDIQWPITMQYSRLLIRGLQFKIQCSLYMHAVKGFTVESIGSRVYGSRIGLGIIFFGLV
jgi:hypothetical protein